VNAVSTGSGGILVDNRNGPLTTAGTIQDLGAGDVIKLVTGAAPVGILRIGCACVKANMCSGTVCLSSAASIQGQNILNSTAAVRAHVINLTLLGPPNGSNTASFGFAPCRALRTCVGGAT